MPLSSSSHVPSPGLARAWSWTGAEWAGGPYISFLPQRCLRSRGWEVRRAMGMELPTFGGA